MTNSKGAMARILRVVRDFLSAHGISDTTVVCALSGGADSVCLLRALVALKEERSITVAALHINHGIRGDEAKRDEDFCRDLCFALGVPLSVFSVNVPREAKESRCSLETAARNARYRVFDGYLSENPGSYIMTAHQATDQAETVLFRLVRGTGARGIAGIPAERGRILRPLLTVTAEEIREALTEENISYVYDTTNADPAYARNRIRGEVLPQLEKVHSGAAWNIARAASRIAEDDAFLTSLAAQLTEGNTEGNRSRIAEAKDPIATRALRILFERARIQDDAPTEEQIRKCLSIARGTRVHARYCFGGGVCFIAERDTVYFDKEEKAEDISEQSVHFGVNELQERNALLILSTVPVTEEEYPIVSLYKLHTQTTICSATMVEQLTVRARRAGDAYRFGGMTHRVKTLFADRKLPLDVRAKIPLLCDERGILWIPGFPARDKSEGEVPLYAYYCEKTKD